MEDFYVQHNGWNIVMFHGGKLVDNRVLIFSWRDTKKGLQWSLRSPVDGLRIASEKVDGYRVSQIEAAAGKPIQIPGGLHKTSVNTSKWTNLAKQHTPKPINEFVPTIGDRRQWTRYQQREK